MKENIQAYKWMREKLSTELFGPLTLSHLDYLIEKIKSIIAIYVSKMDDQRRKDTIQEVIEYLPPKASNGVNLDTELILFSIAIDILIDKYIQTITAVPNFKKSFWNKMNENGLSYEMWLSTNDLLEDYK